MTDGSESASYRTHTNQERMVKCPYCDDTVKSRGLYQHVWRSGDESHGGHKNMPDNWDNVEPEEAGTTAVTIHSPTSKQYDHDLILCKWCGEKFKGTHGLSVHLSRIEDSVHPKDATISESGLRIPAGPNDEPVLEADMLDDLDGHNLDPSQFSDRDVLSTGNAGNVTTEDDDTTQDTPAGYVPVADLVEFIAWLESQEYEEPAQELRQTIKQYR